MTTRLQLDADRRAALLRRSLAEDLRRLRLDAGLSRAAVARAAGVDATMISKVESLTVDPTLETYARIAAALGADLAARTYPNTGPPIHDRHQSQMAEVLYRAAGARWERTPDVAVRRPARGWIDVVLRDTRERTLVATELESDLRRVEQVIRWSEEKAASLPSADRWETWVRDGTPPISRLLIVRRTLANRDVMASARRQLRAAFPADPRDALEALEGSAAWPGPALVWAVIDRGRSRLGADVW